MDNQPVPTPEEKPVSRRERSATLTITSVLTVKTVISVTVGGASKAITLNPQQSYQLPDTAEVRTQLQRYVTSNTIKIQ